MFRYPVGLGGLIDFRFLFLFLFLSSFTLKLKDLGESFVDPRHELEGYREHVNLFYSCVEEVSQ